MVLEGLHVLLLVRGVFLRHYVLLVDLGHADFGFETTALHGFCLFFLLKKRIFFHELSGWYVAISEGLGLFGELEFGAERADVVYGKERATNSFIFEVEFGFEVGRRLGGEKFLERGRGLGRCP